MSNHLGHRKRLKNRFRTEGLDHFELHNVVELLLFFGIPQGDTNNLAHVLVREFGSLSGILDATPEQLMQIKGVGENVATLLSMIPQICRKYYLEKIEIPMAKDDYLENVGRRLVAESIGRTVETIFLVCFDNRMKELFFEIISEGVQDSVGIMARKIAEVAIKTGATNIVLGHNHPTGFAIPSSADKEMTFELKRLLAGISICLLDHIVVAGDDFVSMAQSGMLTRGAFPRFADDY